MKDATLLRSEVLLPRPKRFMKEVLRMRDGHEIDWYYVDTRPSVMVVPVTADGNVVMVKQYRHNLKLETLELPAGVAGEDEPAASAALRELEEETGYSLPDGIEPQPLGRFYALPSETNKYVHIFLATPVVAVGAPQGDTEIEKYFAMSVVQMPFLQALASIGDSIRGLETAGALLLASKQLNR
jgi:8-oxo-dGTP pyrophosphatase MutT (NUDIX family)